MVMGLNDEDRSEIVFFDLETTIPTRTGQGFAILEFGAILVCPKKLVELHSYSTLVRPTDVSLINSLSVRCNGITPDAVSSAPTFTEIADTVFDLLHGRIWAGHNILRFDCVRIREAFAEIGRAAPEPNGTIDSLALLTQRFGRRAGDMKMATLATYFGIGKQTHRSLDDVRMNLEVVKYCATVLFLESSLPDIFTENSWISPNAVTRSRRSMNDNAGQTREEKIHPIVSLMTSNTNQGIDPEPLQSDDSMEVRCSNQPFDVCLPSTSEGSSGFLEPKEVSLPSITASLIPHNPRSQRIRFLHKDVNLQLRCHLKVRFGVNGKFLDFAGRPRLSFLADASPSLCNVLDFCDSVAQKLATDSEWKPIVIRKEGFFNFPTVRLHIPITYADSPRYETEINKRDSCGVVEKLVFSRCDASEIEPLISSGASVDAYFSLDHYEYQQTAGIRLLAKKLLIHSSN